MSGEVQAILSRFSVDGQGLPPALEKDLLRRGLPADRVRAILSTWEMEVRNENFRTPRHAIDRAVELLEGAAGKAGAEPPPPVPAPPAPATPTPQPSSPSPATPQKSKVARRRPASFEDEQQALQVDEKELLIPEERGGEELAGRGGWIRLYRSALKSPELAGDAASLGLFVTLLLLAEWRPETHERESLQPGQLRISLRELCQQTGLSRKQVRRRLEKWQTAGTIWANQRANRYHVITICNYEQFQGKTESKGPTEGQTKGEKRANRGPTDLLKAPIYEPSGAPKKLRSKEEYKKKEDPPPPPPEGGSKPPPYSPAFIEFWNAYPRQKAKGDAWKAWQALRPSKDLLAQMLAALERQKRDPDWTKDGGQYVPYPAGWLRKRRWEDEETPKVTQSQAIQIVQGAQGSAFLARLREIGERAKVREDP